MKRLIIFIFSFLSFNTYANEIEQLYLKGIQNYEHGLFDSAIVKFEKVNDAGYESPELYYNLGNSYFRRGRLAEAVLYFEKALKLAPNDEDIKHNLNFVNSKLIDKPGIYPKFFLFEWIDNIVNAFSVTVWFILTLFIFLVFISALALFFFSNRLKQRVSFSIASVALMFFIAAVVFTGTKYKRVFIDEYAIVNSFSARSTINPNSASNEVFMLHEGSKVEIKDSSGAFYKIRNNDNKEGWINKDDVIVI